MTDKNLRDFESSLKEAMVKVCAQVRDVTVNLQEFLLHVQTTTAVVDREIIRSRSILLALHCNDEGEPIGFTSKGLLIFEASLGSALTAACFKAFDVEVDMREASLNVRITRTTADKTVSGSASIPLFG